MRLGCAATLLWRQYCCRSNKVGFAIGSFLTAAYRFSCRRGFSSIPRFGNSLILVLHQMSLVSMSSLQKVKHKFYLLMSKQPSSRDISIDTSSVSSCRDVHMWRNLANIVHVFPQSLINIQVRCRQVG